MPHRERYLFVCTNRREENHPKGSCAQKGSEEIVKRLKAALLTRGAAARVRACASGCLDLCEIGASIVQEPEHVAYGRVTLADVDAIADAAAAGAVVERLVVHPAPYVSGEPRGRKD
jgi:(2Fe-2S) ferredoxin